MIHHTSYLLFENNICTQDVNKTFSCIIQNLYELAVFNFIFKTYSPYIKIDTTYKIKKYGVLTSRQHWSA